MIETTDPTIMNQFQQMASVIEEMQVPSPLQIANLRDLLSQARHSSSIEMRDWDIILRVVQSSEQLRLALQHWKERLDERGREDQEAPAPVR